MKYFLIGDQGISMRGLKKYLAFLGHEVDGSDLKTGGHDPLNINQSYDFVVRSSAINLGSEGWGEVEAAERLGIPVLKRSELLGQITSDKKLIAVSGMHGKTTISAMAGLTLIEAGFDPTVLVGDIVPEFDDVLRIGKSDWFVAEICEYDRSFLDIYPKMLILSNIEEEHLDTYPEGLPEIMEAFLEYVNHLPSDGTIIACSEDENVVSLLKNKKTEAKIIWYGEGSQYSSLPFELKIPGKHNITNALSILALCDCLGIDKQIAENVLKGFQGAKRRFEKIGNYNGAILIDDYGHHPTEISATVKALAEKFPEKKKTVIFWPHQYKRILPFLKKFGQVFGEADSVMVLPIYFVPGRDEELPVKSEDIVAEINKLSPNKAVYVENEEKAVELLREKLNEQSVLLTIGIPPVYRVAESLMGVKHE